MPLHIADACDAVLNAVDVIGLSRRGVPGGLFGIAEDQVADALIHKYDFL